MLTSRINAPDFSGPADSSGVRPPGSSGKVLPGQTKSAGDPKAGVKPGSPNQARPSSRLLTASPLLRLGLSNDKLSASIVAFARYFSLPLESGLLAKIRRQSLSADTGNAALAKPQSPKSLLQVREALSLAAAAAADKGVELSRDSLVDYARSLSQHLAVDPDKGRSAGDGQGDDDGFGTGSDRSSTGGDGGDKGDTGSGGTSGNPESSAEAESRGSLSDKGRNRGKFTGDAESLRNKILQAGEQNPLISLMNRLPGKNGQRWMVFPFAFEDQGRNFMVTLRILLIPDASAGNSGFRAERMALEISGEDQQWLFIADTQPSPKGEGSPLDNPPNGKLRLSGSLWPGGSKSLQSLEKELAGLLGLAQEQVQLRNGEEFPPFAPDSRNETLLSVNEEV